MPIVDAWIEADKLVLLSPSFERLIVPLLKLKKYIGNNPDETRTFELDEDGSFLYWPHADAHLGWQQFIRITDPAAALAAKQEKRDFNEKYGAAIRTLRGNARLRQIDIPGVTSRNLRRVEHGEIAATKSTLESLAKAHGTSLDDYLQQLAAAVL